MLELREWYIIFSKKVPSFQIVTNTFSLVDYKGYSLGYFLITSTSNDDIKSEYLKNDDLIVYQI